ncbi:MAG: AsmA family protein [Chitinophagaceae bacterium]|nr:MAG: AsmA family protein [Chitinophagaceae bacterium]
MNKTLRYILRGIGIATAALIIFWLAILWYVSSHKADIISQVTEELSLQTNGKVDIGDLDPAFFQTFPFLSLRLTNISIRDSLWHVHKNDFLKAEKFFIRVNPFSLLASKPTINKIIVENGSLFIFTDTTSYTNAYILNPKKKATKKGLRPPFDGVEFKNVRLRFINPSQAKIFDFDIRKLVCNVDGDDNETELGIKLDMLVHNLGFNTERGVYLNEKTVEGKFDITLLQELITFEDIRLRIDKHPFSFSGRFELGTDPNFTLQIDTRKARYGQVTKLLTERLQRKLDTFSLGNTVEAKAFLNGSLLPGTTPVVQVDWVIRKSDLHTPFGDFENVSMIGKYHNLLDSTKPASDDNSIIQAKSFTGTWEKIPLVSSEIAVTKLSSPQIAFDLRATVDMVKLNELTGTGSFDFAKGKAAVNITMSAPIMKGDSTPTLIRGTVDIVDGAMTYLPRKLALDGCNGTLVFENKDVVIKITDKRGNKKARFSNAAGRIDELIELAAMKINLNAKKLKHKNFNATNVKASVGMDKDIWTLHNVSLNHAGGRVEVKGSLNANGNLNPLQISGNMQNLDISDVFYAFDNFSIDGLTNKHLKGDLTADFAISATINSEAEVVPYSTRGTLNISLKNGALQNFEPMQKISNSVFKNRDMSDIRFAELKDRFNIDGTSIKVNSLEIQSTVLSMFIEGIYDLKTGPDLSILVPLSNLKKRGDDFELVNKGTDSKKGLSVHLRARNGDDGKVKIVWDPFKKAIKNKEKKSARTEKRRQVKTITE